MRYTVTMTVTERTRQKVEVEADSPEEATRLVREYELDNSTYQEIESLEWSVDEVTATEL